MSYILDALRKAESERQRGTVPGLDTQPASASSNVIRPRPDGARRWPALAAGLGVVLLLAGLATYMWRPWGGAAVQAPAVMTPPASLTVPAAVPLQGAPQVPSQAMVQAPAQIPVPAPAAMPATVPLPSPAAAPAPVLTPAVTPSPPTAPVAAALPRLADLPPAQRQGLPSLVVGGAVQSPDPAARMLIVDGQVLREGDAAAPGLVLERIGPRAAVFSLQGLRFEVPL